MQSMSGSGDLDWVILTTGARPSEVERPVASIEESDADTRIVVVSNGAGDLAEMDLGHATVVTSSENLGVPAGRDLGLRSTSSPVVGFLDDDAVLLGDAAAQIAGAFREDPTLGAVALHMAGDHGQVTRRHVPVVGTQAPHDRQEVAYFVGCAHALRRAAYDDAGGYFGDLFYSHEEIELCWRLIDAGWTIRFLDASAYHPTTEIGRHRRGWWMTGRNRVWIARRTLPWPVAVIHVASWFVGGLVRAPTAAARRAYVRGWLAGWRSRVEHDPIRWATVWRLTRLGRPPLI